MPHTIDIQVIPREDREGILENLEHKGYAFVPKDANPAWTARAIWENKGYPFDILYDRQTCSGDEDKRKELVEWLNKSGLKALCDAFVQNGFRTKTTDYVLLRDGKFSILGSPNGSYGYAYLGAWLDE